MEINHKNVILYGAVQYIVSLILMTMEVDVHVHVFYAQVMIPSLLNE